ncbi:uncharacterized protein LOC142221824 isoform X1 [Haematobia irritans]|uniref:uncharacterized protein LOC142221824 isoform X1 n=1 Tax=Haematobia irritans TaxID=7368 RepID=UPI003F50B9C7
MLKTIITLCIFVGVSVNGQRVAPGVPPQHYQQPVQHQQPPHPQHQQQYQQVHPNQLPPGVNPQQYQHQQQQQAQYQQQQQIPVHQQVPVQQVPVQQVPVQQVPVQQVPVQQVPVPQQQGHPQGHGAAHHHTGHANHGQVLNAANIQNEKEHIQEHLHVPIDTSKMSEAELQFHYFKMHDSDNNNKLDGCELIKSLIHWHEQGNKDGHNDGQQPHVEEKIFTDEELVALIDPILQMDDSSKDGYIDYPEFMRAQQKSQQQQQQQQQKQT